MPITPHDIQEMFVYHPPQDNQVSRYQELREAGKLLAFQIVSATPEGREQSLAITKLREAIMWTNAAIALENPVFPKS